MNKPVKHRTEWAHVRWCAACLQAQVASLTEEARKRIARGDTKPGMGAEELEQIAEALSPIDPPLAEEETE